jgi:circadian clock protein KaiB
VSTPADPTFERYEDALSTLDDTFYELTLVVSGASDLSLTAIANARRLCDTYLGGRHSLTVVDLHEEPTAVLSSQILAAPTLVKHLPLPMRKLVGDLSHTEKVLMALGLPTAAHAQTPLSVAPHETAS